MDELAYLQAIADRLRAELRAVMIENANLTKTILENNRTIQRMQQNLMELTHGR